MIAVTFALPAESSEFLRSLSDTSQSDRNGVRIVRGNIGDRRVAVMHTGVGEKPCTERLRKFLEDQKFDLLVSSGFAGALNDEFEVGDLLLAKNFSTIELNKSRLSFSELRVAELLTLPRLIDSAGDRKRIARTSGAAAVDMETEFIARKCAEQEIPLLSLRAITDTPGEPFPVAPDILFNLERQRTDMISLAAFLFAHPGRIFPLLQFARKIAHVRKILASALVEIVQRIEVGSGH